MEYVNIHEAKAYFVIFDTIKKLIKIKHIFLIVVCTLFSLNNAYSQGFSRPNDWKKIRKELFVNIGISQFLGDLGGLNKTGTNYSPADLEFSLTRPALSIGYRYKILKNLNWNNSFNYLVVAGDDALTQDIYRHNRNLNFKSNIFEVATRIELSYLSSKKGNRYGIKRTMGRRHKGRTWEFMGFIGVAGFYYNPKGRSSSGNYVALKPLHTEGQGLAGGPKQYSNYSISIPMGIAYRLIIQKKYSIGLEINYRKTFTDYIDDVSTRYYDNDALKAAYGSQSAQLADPNLGLIYGATLPDGDGLAAQRGDVQPDTYLSFQITVGKFFAPKKGKSRLRSKF